MWMRRAGKSWAVWISLVLVVIVMSDEAEARRGRRRLGRGRVLANRFVNVPGIQIPNQNNNNQLDLDVFGNFGFNNGFLGNGFIGNGFGGNGFVGNGFIGNGFGHGRFGRFNNVNQADLAALVSGLTPGRFVRDQAGNIFELNQGVNPFTGNGITGGFPGVADPSAGIGNVGVVGGIPGGVAIGGIAGGIRLLNGTVVPSSAIRQQVILGNNGQIITGSQFSLLPDSLNAAKAFNDAGNTPGTMSSGTGTTAGTGNDTPVVRVRRDTF